MKRSFIIILILTSFFLKKAAAQMYWEMAPWVFETKKTKGMELKLDNNNRLAIFTNNAIIIGNGEDFKKVLTIFFENFNKVKDSLKPDMAYKLYFFYNPGAKNGLTILPYKTKNKRFVVVDQQPAQSYENQNMVYIFPRQKGTISNVFAFYVNEIDDLHTYEQSNLINDFIQKLNKEISTRYPKARPVTSGNHFAADGNYYTRFTGSFTEKNGTIDGTLKSINQTTGRYTLSPSIAANLQNYKGNFAPSFNAGFDFFTKSLINNSLLRIGAYWEPVFLFGKNNNGSTKTWRNDFVGLIWETRNYKEGEKYNTELKLYAPMSIAYLAHRSGDYFEKNTFQIGVGGVKYGAMTLRPFMYFNNFFKGISPSVQISIGFGR